MPGTTATFVVDKVIMEEAPIVPMVYLSRRPLADDPSAVPEAPTESAGISYVGPIFAAKVLVVIKTRMRDFESVFMGDIILRTS